MKTRVLSSVRVNHRLLVVAVVLVLAAASLALAACGDGSSGSDDRAFIDKFMAMWDSNDAAAAKELFADNAVITWPEGTEPPVVGLDAIAETVASYPADPLPAGDIAFTYVPSDEDLKYLAAAKYEGAHYIACPVMLGSDLYMMVLELRDGKVLNQWVSSMYTY